MGPDGNYKVTDLAAGAYKLQFSSSSGEVLEQWYQNATSFSSATPVTVTAGQNLAGINVTVTKAATISGKVFVPAGVSRSGIGVTAVPSASQWQSGGQHASVALDGSYKIMGLVAGTYKIQFSGAGTGALDEWHLNGASFETATALTLTAGQDLIGLNATLAKGATISGKVTAPAGVNLSDAYVSATPAASNGSPLTRSGSVSSDGSYKVIGLAAGAYKLQFSGRNTGALEQWYRNADSFETATAVTVTAGQDLTGINTTLVKGATISGKVTAPAGVNVANVSVEVWSADMRHRGESTLGQDGSYKLTGLPAGSYKLHFSGWNTGAVDQWHKNAASSVTATAVTVATGQDLTGVNASLVKAPTVSGKVTLPTGMSASSIHVALYSATDPERWTHIPVNADGTYKATATGPGSYKLAFRGGASGAADQWYKAASSFGTATAVNLAAAQDLTGINATLVRGATISGRVTAPAGVELRKVTQEMGLVAATTVLVYAAGSSTTEVASADVNADGTYQVTGLSAGSYKFFIVGRNTAALDQWYDRAASFAGARTLSVTAGQNLTGINPALSAASAISGKITGGAVYTPVNVLNTAGAIVKTGYSNVDGTFNVGGLAAGSYKVAFNRASGSSVAEAQFYNNKGESAGVGAAQTLTVGAGQTVASINATLVTGGTITGLLKDKAGIALANARVQAYTRDGRLITRSGSTDSSGRFSVRGLSTGSYFVVARSSVDGTQIYSGNVATESNAKAITVAVGKTTDLGTLSFGTPAPAALTAAPVPTVTGLAVTGQKLTAVPGTWGPAPVALAYQWKRSGVTIVGATASTYVLTATDLGKTMTVTVTGSKAGYVTAARTSLATKAVAAPAALTAAPVPTVTGLAVTGQKLTAVPGTWG
ncbi:carboxypeptidase regulatory-like domain-containing protein, partial [Pseudarthrobacter sp. PvP090]|uniref:beta strand repeat-containing protein n=1 Tax=Pseudarthrobacter sp. PvP090 TaxID=3156393 RepID=UPI003394BCA3